MRAATLLLLAALLAGCSGAPAGGHFAAGVVATAEYPLPVDPDRVEEVARGLGWEVKRRTVVEDAFSLDLVDADGRAFSAQKRPQGENWTLTHIFEIPERERGMHATAEEAAAEADAAWEGLQDDFARLVAPFEAAGGWERLRMRHACYCAER